MEAGLQNPPVSPARPERAENAAEAYKRVEDQMLALSVDDVGRVTADVGLASSIALGALPNLEKLRPEFSQLADGGAAVKALDSLNDYALAAFYAHLESAPDSSQSELAALLERARPLRENLLKVAEALAGFGLFSPVAVSAIREGSGHLDTAKDLAQLGALFDSNWERVASKVPFERALVDEASKLGTVLLRAIGAKEVGDVRKDPSYDWSSLRARAFRLMVNAYEDLRRATAYVRWHHGDALAYTPSLHTRPASRRRDRGEAEPVEAEPLVSEQVALGGNAPAAEAGLPGASPFAKE
jgi:hypothetical protein